MGERHREGGVVGERHRKATKKRRGRSATQSRIESTQARAQEAANLRKQDARTLNAV